MNGLKNQRHSSGSQENLARPVSPSKNREEWLKRHGYKFWPLEDELGLQIQEPEPPLFQCDTILGTPEEIRQDLRDHAGWDDDFFSDVDARLSALEETLSKTSQQFMAELSDKKDSKLVSQDGLRMVRIKSHKLCDGRTLRAMKKASSPADKLFDGRRVVEVLWKLLEAIFPGFPGGLAPLLPGKIETLQLLDTVTKAQNFGSAFLKVWKKIIFSDPSTSFLQLCFWWLWMERYGHNADHSAELYTQMAESFTDLVMMSDGKKKDEIFQALPSCLSQAIYSVYIKAFPNSIREFYTSEFRQWLCDNIYQLTTGISSPVECWTKWPMKALDPTYITEDISTTTHQPSLATSIVPSPNNIVTFEGSASLNKSQNVKRREDSYDSKSPGIGSAPVFENVKFGTVSCSPLLQHQLWVHGLIDSSQLNMSRQHNVISRTQIKELPPATMTYTELIKTVARLSKQRYKEYSKELAVYEQEIHKAVQEFYATRREIQQTTKRILKHKYEVALEADKIMAAQLSKLTASADTTNAKED